MSNVPKEIVSKLKGKYKAHILTGYSVKEANRSTSAVVIVLSKKQIVIYQVIVCIYTLNHNKNLIVNIG
jgi:hypothetical protein